MNQALEHIMREVLTAKDRSLDVLKANKNPSAQSIAHHHLLEDSLDNIIESLEALGVEGKK